jgi:hypothetical protein
MVTRSSHGAALHLGHLPKTRLPLRAAPQTPAPANLGSFETFAQSVVTVMPRSANVGPGKWRPQEHFGAYAWEWSRHWSGHIPHSEPLTM